MDHETLKAAVLLKYGYPDESAEWYTGVSEFLAKIVGSEWVPVYRTLCGELLLESMAITVRKNLNSEKGE